MIQWRILFISLAFVMKMTRGISMCNNASILKPENINIFTYNIYHDILKNENSFDQMRNIAVSPLAFWFVASKQTNQSKVCQEVLDTIESGMKNKYAVPDKHEKSKPSNIQLTSKNVMEATSKVNKYIYTYSVIKLVTLSVKICGVINPQLTLKYLPMFYHRTALVPVMDFYIDVDYEMNLAFKTTFLTFPLSEDSRLKMSIILPGDFVSLKESVQLLRDARATGWGIPGSSTKKIVHVELPSFQIKSVVDVTTSMMRLGLINAFNNTKIKKLANTFNGAITAIIQNNTITVNDYYNSVERENINKNNPLEIQSFVVNKPFVAEITYDNVVIFIAHIFKLN